MLSRPLAEGPTQSSGVATGAMTTTAPMSKQDIIRAHAELEQLQLDMARRSAGGKQASGRYKKHDSARKVFIQTVAMPSLRMGKRIDADDWRRLFLPGDDEIAGADKSGEGPGGACSRGAEVVALERRSLLLIGPPRRALFHTKTIHLLPHLPTPV